MSDHHKVLCGHREATVGFAIVIAMPLFPRTALSPETSSSNDNHELGR
jgi:hypothetical protein